MLTAVPGRQCPSDGHKRGLQDDIKTGFKYVMITV